MMVLHLKQQRHMKMFHYKCTGKINMKPRQVMLLQSFSGKKDTAAIPIRLAAVDRRRVSLDKQGSTLEESGAGRPGYRLTLFPSVARLISAGAVRLGRSPATRKCPSRIRKDRYRAREEAECENAGRHLMLITF